MVRAGSLLQKTGMKIQEVADQCGYDNQRYFASSFKKFYGCTPTEFKKVVEEEHLY
ncbi:MAG: helix-turn-helix domain-containing protein [Hungatella sp.]|nr:helix-turn-helix domain-containing protein [Hungatella sp.]